MSVSLFFAIYCLEAGLFFLVAPWTRMWTVNPLLQHHATLAIWAANPFVRGFISGLGMIHLILGVRDLVTLARRRREGAGQ